MAETVALTIFVAVDNRGDGYVLAWTGNQDRADEYALSQAETFAEEVSTQGRACEDIMLENPKELGLYRFDGRMGYRGTIWDDREGEPWYDGSWTTLHPLTLIYDHD